MADIFTVADLLREINRRQELREHDQQVLAALAVSTSLDSGEWLIQLARLTGLDDELDLATDQVRASGDLAPALNRLRALATQ